LAAQAGVYSAVFAGKGITAAKEVLQGKFGYYPVYQRGEYDVEKLLEDLGKKFAGIHVTTKMYPCCMHTHSAIEAIRNLARSHPLPASEVEKVSVKVNQQGYNFVCIPPAKAYHPQTVPEAQFSLPFVVATALIKGNVFLEDFTEEAIQSPEVRHIASKVDCTVDPGLEQTSPGKVSPAIVEVRTQGGKIFTERVDERKGCPANPMTMEEVEDKFRRCMKFAKKPIPAEKGKEIISFVHELEASRDVGQVVKLF